MASDDGDLDDDKLSLERRYRSMFDQSPLPMWMFDRETLAFVAVNDAAIRHYGYSRDEFLALTIADIRPPEDLELLRQDVGTAAGLGAPKIWRHLKKDGTQIHVEIQANDFTLDGRRVRLVVIQDVEERERAQAALRKTEDQLRHAQKMDAIGLLAGGVAHDFNNVLTVISSYACMLEESLEADDSRRAEAAEIRKASERAAAITRQLLTLSRHSISAPKALDLDALVAGFVPMLKRLLGAPITLVTPRASMPPVLADANQMEQVLMNLAINARDAMPGGGRLTIATTVETIDDDAARQRQVPGGQYVVLAVTDTGTGMDRETQRRIFDPFFTTKEVGKGTGLGLSIVHGIVTQAGGWISVYSEPGHGTTFRVHLPVNDRAPAAASAPGLADAPTTLPAVTTLVVDDQRELRAVTARILSQAGCQVLEAASGDEARRMCVEHDNAIEVAIVDLVLPDGRGDVIARQLRELRPSLAVVLISGYPAGALGPSGAAPPDLLAKPFNPAELRGAVARALRASGAVTAQPSEALGARSTPRVLVVDDDAQLRRTIARVFRRAGLEVIAVDGGRNAVAALEATAFDVIVSDVHMPNGDGLELVRTVRRVDLDVPVILMSGVPDVRSAAAAVEYGAFRYITKPFDTDELARLVQHATRAHTLARLRRAAFSATGRPADRAGLDVRLELAIERMWVALQPVVEATSGAVYGYEALVRSDEPTFAQPTGIFDAAAQLGLSAKLGTRIRALAVDAIGHKPGAARLFLNLHPDHLLHPELVDEHGPLAALAARTIFEITERATLRPSPELTRRLSELRQLGYRIALDDLGAGASGLTSFTELTPELVKISLSLVRDVQLSAHKQRTIAALCKLCHELGCQVIANGVETTDERDALIELGCDFLQGFLLGPPERAARSTP